MGAVTRGTGEGNGVLHGDALVRFVNAALQGADEAELGEARDELCAAVGVAGMIDAAAVIASFTVQNRAVDGAGLPLDALGELATRTLREQLGTDQYATAANTPKGGRLSGIAARVLGWFVPTLLRAVGRRASRRANARSAQGHDAGTDTTTPEETR